jgi:hypothetical protein
MILALLMAGGVGALFSARTDLRTSGNLKTARQAFYIAEAGLSRAWQELNDGDGRNDFDALWSATGNVSLYDNESFAGGSHTVTATRLSGSGVKRVQITAIGCLPAAAPCPSGHSRAVLEAQLRRGSLFECVICATESVTLSAGAKIDSYDSRTGPYRSEAAARNGHVRSDGNVVLSGATTVVDGNVLASTGVSITDGATVNGLVSEGAPLQRPSPKAPCGPPFHDGSGVSGGSYNAETGELRGAGSDAIMLLNGTYCFSSVTLADASTLTVNGPVRIHVMSPSSFAGGGMLNTTAAAENLTIYSSVASADLGLTVGSGSLAYMTVYAPRAKITILGSGDFFGAVVGRTVVNVGAARLHYDEKLADNEEGNVALVSWREVF